MVFLTLPAKWCYLSCLTEKKEFTTQKQLSAGGPQQSPPHAGCLPQHGQDPSTVVWLRARLIAHRQGAHRSPGSTAWETPAQGREGVRDPNPPVEKVPTPLQI